VAPKHASTPEERIAPEDWITELVVGCMLRFEEDADMQLVASAILYYLTVQDPATRQATSGRRNNPVRIKALKAVLHVLRVYEGLPSGLQLAKNCCLTLRNFNTEEELALHSCEVASAKHPFIL